VLNQTKNMTREAVQALQPALQTISKYDQKLAQQLNEAAASIADQLAVADTSETPASRAAQLRAAAAAAEVGVMLSMSVVKGYVQPKYSAFLRTRLDTITERLRHAAAA